MTSFPSTRPAFVALAVLLSASGIAAADALTFRNDSVPSGGATLATLTLSQPPAAMASFVVRVTGSNLAQVPERIQVPGGQTRVDFVVTSVPAASEQFAEVKIVEPGSTQVVAGARLTVTPPTISTFTLNRSEAVGGTPGSTVTATVTLDGVAAAPGLNVALGQSCSNCQADSTPLALPPAVRVQGGSRTASFSFEPHPVSSTRQFTVLASLGSSVKTAPLVDSVLRPQSVSVSPSTIAGTQTATLTIQLNAPAYANYPMKITCSAGALQVTVAGTEKSCPLPGSNKELQFTATAGQGSMSLSLRNNPSGSPTQATIRIASISGADVQTTLTIAP